MDEFGLIRRYFTRRARHAGVIVGVGDDGAILEPAAGLQQVQVIDTVVEGVHFPRGLPAADVGYRVVAVNLSDIASMGAVPRWMTLALTLAGQDEQWVEGFASGLFEAADAHGVDLVGGDTTRGAVAVATVHVTGEIEAGRALLRSGARTGDTVFVTGSPGDAAAGLSLLEDGRGDDYLTRRFRRPTPRIATGRALVGVASACIDVSDGLVGDLRKLCEASGVGADVDVGSLPLSDDIVAAFGRDRAIEFALTGGDDYELCFTASADAVAGLDGVTAIGVITDGGAIVCRRDGAIVDVDDGGYRHFA